MPGRQDNIDAEGVLQPRMSYAAPFNPTSLVIQGGFYRADVGVSQTSGSVTAWADQSSNANNLGFQVVGPPLWGATKFNTSFAGVGFNTTNGTGSTDRIMTNFNNGSGTFAFHSTTMSMFGLATVTASLTGGDILTGLLDLTTGNQNATPSVEITAQSATQFRGQSSGLIGNGGAGATFTANVPQVFGLICDGSAAHLYLNFVEQGSSTAFSSTLGNTAATSNAYYMGNQGASCWSMVLAWSLMTSKALSAGDISNLKSWTNSNWGTSF